MARTVNVLAFAGARDIVGASQLSIKLAPDTVTAGHLMDQLCERFQPLAGYRHIVRLAVNGHYVEAEALLADGDEVALIPPVAGG
ncbi:MAG TPA: molybdopterin converting factor subunit 1 [Sorangium sp.]|nr:molybdopterin converting factor subunit 1 [Sorangium sp.]